MVKNQTEQQLTATTIESRPVLAGGLKRKWKAPAQKFSRHVHNFINDGHSAWEKKKEQKQLAQTAKEIEAQIKEQRAAERQAAKERKANRAKRAAENALRSSTVQVIKNTAKIKKWSAKAKRQLVKMSPEMVQQLYGK